MKSKYIALILIGLIAALVIAAYSYKDEITTYFLSVEDKRRKIIDYVANVAGDEPTAKTIAIAAINRMNNEEIEAVYEAIFNNILKGKALEQTNPLFTAFTIISEKYNLFT